ncbi:DNA internalization-related competence protein ComEC/Rec2 [Arsenicicoccus dermatophilus]|uniref:DNA internalization-related competence protein ComEC/Rec2 n=1 Tax=Arsenicicoccus dermatophilus TaxID=1076331 RepID=UPI0039174212
MSRPGLPDGVPADLSGPRGGRDLALGAAELDEVVRRERVTRVRRAVGLGGGGGGRRPSRWLHDVRPTHRADVRLLLPACVAWAVLAWALPQPGRVLTLLVVGSLAWALAAARWGRRPRRPAWVRRWAPSLALCGVITALTTTALAGHRAVRAAGTVDELAGQRAVVRLVADVASDPRALDGGNERVPSIMVRLQVRSVEGRGQVSRVTTPVLAFARDPAWQRMRWGQTVALAGRLTPAAPEDEVVAVVQVRGPPRPIREPGPVARAAEHVRAALRASVQGLPADGAGLVPALVVGDTSLTPPDLTRDMTTVQMSHLSAVSGSNVSVVLAAVVGLCGLVGLPRRLRPAIALVGLAGFVVLARPEPSVLRAAVMGGVGLVGISADRERAAFPALGAAVAGLLVWDPWLARSYGFVLSTLATLGLLVFATPWGEAVGRRLPARVRGWGPALAIPVAAQVMCGPVTVLLQPAVSLVGVPANLLAAPFVGPTTVLGIATALVAAVSVPLAHLLAWPAVVPAWLVARVARVAADVPYGSIPWAEGAVGAGLLAVLTVLLVLTGRRLAWWARLRPVLAAAVVVVILAWCLPTTGASWPVTGWSAVVCDVGQGDGIVLSSGPGRGVLVDVGPPGPAARDCLSRLGIHQLDAVVVSHFHNDHSGGLDEVLEAFPTARLVVTGTRDPEGEARRVERSAAAHHLTAQVARAGDRLDVGDVHAQVLGPRREIHDGSVPNNASLVLLVEVRGTRLLLTGDIEPAAAADVRRAAGGRWPDVDVLKVAHHGSAKQDPALLRSVHAPLALISVGKDNDYGQPAPSALTMLREAGSTVARTDQDGDLAVLGHGADLRLARRGR